MSRPDVEGDIVEVALLCFVDQPGPFVWWERVGVIVGDENSSRDLFSKGVAVVLPVVGDEIFLL